MERFRMGKIVLRKFRKPEVSDSKVIRIDMDVYEKLSDISEETSISVQKLTSILLNTALAEVVVVDDEESEETN